MNAEQATTMARYNQWINLRLYEVCGRIFDNDRKIDRGLFFGSIHGTLNHILLADKLWMGRFMNDPVDVTGLDQELFEEFEALREARAETDKLILDWTSGLTESELGGELHYRSITNPADHSCPLWLAVTHVFNHQTHHRGQITAVLSQMEVDYGVTDLIYLPGRSDL